MSGVDTEPVPLALYIHIPWCVRKCPYCDFNSHELTELPETDYVQALRQDLQQDRNLAQGRPLHSIFFGGGTPSLFSAAAIADILEEARSQIGFAEAIEITLEANPGATEYTSLPDLRSAGVNRLSFGVQSFNDLHLQRLGRIHSRQQAHLAFKGARQAGFDNINLDLMHGLPGQSVAEAMDDLQQAIDLGPEHLSWYQLTIEPNTVFHKQPPLLPEDDILADIQETGLALLQQAGYRQYEISAFSRPGRRALHNLNYWQFGDYLAIGAGAHGKITEGEGRILRYHKTRLPADYLDPDKTFTAGATHIERNALPLEFMMNALRLIDGVPRPLFPRRTGLPDSDIEGIVNRLIERGLLASDADRYRPSVLGLRFLNDTLQVFAPDHPIHPQGPGRQ